MPVNNSPSHGSPVSAHTNSSPLSEPGSPQWSFDNSAFNRLQNVTDGAGHQEPLSRYSGSIELGEGSSSHVPRLSAPSEDILRIAPLQNILAGHESNSETLDLSGMSLRSLQNIFDGTLISPHLLELELSGNQLTSLPAALGNLSLLMRLDVQDNRLSSLPDDFFQNMASLQILNLANNRLSTLPESILHCPALSHLDLSGNQFTEFPAVVSHLPPGCTLILDNNPWSVSARTDLGQAGVGEHFQIPSGSEPGGLPSFPDSLSRWLPDGVHLPSLAGAEQEIDADSFNLWLNRLPQTKEFTEATGPFFKERIRALLQEMDADPTLRQLCFNCAQEAITTCVDRITLGLNNMEMAAINREAELGLFDENALLQLGQGMHRLELLEQVARVTNWNLVANRHFIFMEEAVDSLARLANLPPLIRASGDDAPAAVVAYVKRALELAEQADRILVDSTLPARKFHRESFSETDGLTRVVAFFSERTEHIDGLLKRVAASLAARRLPVPPLPTPEKIIIDEAVEVFLAYQLMLKDRLKLPVEVQGMQFAACADLTAEDLENAVESVKEDSQNLQQQHLFLSQWMPLQKHLERSHNDELKGITDFYSEKMDSLLEDGPLEGETEGQWKARVDQTAKERSESIEQFYQRHTAALIGYIQPTSNTPQH